MLITFSKWLLLFSCLSDLVLLRIYICVQVYVHVCICVSNYCNFTCVTVISVKFRNSPQEFEIFSNFVYLLPLLIHSRIIEGAILVPFLLAVVWFILADKSTQDKNKETFLGTCLMCLHETVSTSSVNHIFLSQVAVFVAQCLTLNEPIRV